MEELAARIGKVDQDIPTFLRRSHWGIETPDPGTVYTFREGSRRFEPGIVFARKAANEDVTSSTTLQNDDELLFTAGANEKWSIFIFLLYSAAAAGATPGFKVGWSGPSGATADWHRLGRNAAEVVQLDYYVTQESEEATTTTDPFLIWGSLKMGSTGGTVNFQWAQANSSVSATTVETGSTLVAQRFI